MPYEIDWKWIAEHGVESVGACAAVITLAVLLRDKLTHGLPVEVELTGRLDQLTGWVLCQLSTERPAIGTVTLEQITTPGGYECALYLLHEGVGYQPDSETKPGAWGTSISPDFRFGRPVGGDQARLSRYFFFLRASSASARSIENASNIELEVRIAFASSRILRRTRKTPLVITN